jgi:PAS domain S-box-containing protein
VFDLEGTYLYVSPACRKILGVEPEDLIGAQPDSRLGEDTSRQLWEKFNREIYDKGWGTLLFQHTFPDGREIWLESSATVALDADGEPSEIVSVIRDVTDRMETEQELRDSQQVLEDLAAERTRELRSANRKLRASEARYRAISQLVMGYVFSAALSDESYEMLWMEGQVEETAGWSVEEIKAVHWSELIYPEDLASAARFVRNLTRGRAEVTEFRIIQKDGGNRWLRMYAQKMGTDEHGRTVVVGACQDVTEAKEREASLRHRTRLLERVTENAPDLILRLDRDARCIYANRLVEEVIAKPVSEVLGKTAEQLGMPGHVASLGRTTAREVIDRCEPQELEFSMVGPKGQRIYEARVVPEVEEDGTIPAALAIIRDVTEHRRAREQLEQERSALQKANVALEELMARIRQEPVEVSQRIQANVDKVIMPMIHSLQQQASPQQQRSLELLGEALSEIAAPHVDKLSQQFSQLTASELRICDMVRRGLSSKEIANILDISVSTVSRHRENIRRKLDLAHRGVNLAAFLRTHDADEA